MVHALTSCSAAKNVEGAVGGCLVELLVISDGGEECINSIMGLMAFFGAKLVWGEDVGYFGWWRGVYK
jgi:hypothetical protein